MTMPSTMLPPTLAMPHIRDVAGEVHLPGSKSLSNRALLMAALADGTTHIRNLLDSDDTRRMIAALRTLGVPIWHDPAAATCRVDGCAGPLPAPSTDNGQPLQLHLGNAGTAMRPLLAALCLSPDADIVLHGDPRMHERPIGHLVDALRQTGATIDYLGNPGFPPLRIRGGGLRGGRLQIAGNISSQFLTALLIALPLAAEDAEIEVTGDLVSKPYIDLTLGLQKQFGITAEHDDYRLFRTPAGQTYRAPQQLLVEGDASSASYFLAAAAICGGSVRVRGIGRHSVQGDAQFAEVLAAMGAQITCGDDWIEATRGGLHGVDLDLNHIPDAAMTVAVTALFADGPTRIRNIYNWRVKETDRLHAMATELVRLGATVEEGDDYLHIAPPDTWRDATIRTYEDHRMAMCFALAAAGPARIVIDNPGCVSKTFPDFFATFAAISGEWPLVREGEANP